MALFLKQDDERSELQKQIAAELHRKASEKSAREKMHDGVEDSQFIKGSRKTTNIAWIWFLLIILVTGFIIWLTLRSMAR